MVWFYLERHIHVENLLSVTNIRRVRQKNFYQLFKVWQISFKGNACFTIVENVDLRSRNTQESVLKMFSKLIAVDVFQIIMITRHTIKNIIFCHFLINNIETHVIVIY